MSKNKNKIHRVLREVYRHYYEFQDYVAQTGNHVIEHGGVSISFYDLRDGLKSQDDGGVLSDRKRQAVMLNVIADMKQRDVAEKMGITTVSVGQYVETAMELLSKTYFTDLEREVEKVA